MWDRLTRSRTVVRWLIGLALLIATALLLLHLADRADRSRYFAGKHVRVALICEPSVRRVTLAYVKAEDSPFSDRHRIAALNDARRTLGALGNHVEVIDRGVIDRPACSDPLVPSSSQQLTVLISEQADIQRVSTLHYGPRPAPCRSGRLDILELNAFMVAQQVGEGLHPLNQGSAHSWAENLPRIVSSQCRGGYHLPGADNVAPRNRRVVDSVRSQPPSVGE